MFSNGSNPATNDGYTNQNGFVIDTSATSQPNTEESKVASHYNKCIGSYKLIKSLESVNNEMLELGQHAESGN